MLALVPCVSLLCALPATDSRVVARVPAETRVVEGSLRFARGGVQCVYAVIKGERQCPVVGSTLGSEYGRVSWPNVDPSGKHTAFHVRAFEPRRKVSLDSVLYDGKVIATDDWVGPVALDPARGLPAYWIAKGRIVTASGGWESGAATLAWGKYKSSKWQFVEEVTPPRFSLDGSLLVTNAARGNGDWNVLTVDTKGQDDKHAGGSVFDAVAHPAGHGFAYTYAELVGDEHWTSHPQQFLVAVPALDPRGKASGVAVHGRAFESSGSPVYSGDGRHLAYKVLRASKMGVAIDDRPASECDFTFVEEIAPKPDGSDVAFVAANGCKLDKGKGREVLPGVEASGGHWFVVEGSTRHGPYADAHSPVWSRDGQALAYAARIQGKWRVFMGSKQGEPCDEIAGLAWAEDGWSVSYGCLRGADVLWCTLGAD